MRKDSEWQAQWQSENQVFSINMTGTPPSYEKITKGERRTKREMQFHNCVIPNPHYLILQYKAKVLLPQKCYSLGKRNETKSEINT